jgi:hypothetical protein
MKEAFAIGAPGRIVRTCKSSRTPSFFSYVTHLAGGILMRRYSNPLDHVTVAAPCSADWDAMLGDERTRFCGQCNLSVYNLSGMTRSEAKSLLSRNEGRLCVRFYRRADGTIITKNCPVGLLAIKRRVSRLKRAVISMTLSFLTGVGLFSAFPEKRAIVGDLKIEERPPLQVTGDFPIQPTQPRVELQMGGLPGRPVHVMGGRAVTITKPNRRSKSK